MAMRRKGGVWLGFGAAIALVALGLSLRSEHAQGFVTIAGAEVVEIPVGSIAPGEARFFVYRAHGGGETRLIVARDDQGHLQAVLDACERCYPYHRGYTAGHHELTCNYCGTHYKVGAIAHGMAGCEPVKISFRTVGQAILIKTAELERQSKFF